MKFIRYNIFFVFSLLLCFDDAKAQNTFQQGQDLFDKADYQKAQTTFSNLVGQTKNSTDTLAYYQAQLAYMRTCLSLNQLSTFSKSYQQEKLYTEYNAKSSKRNSKKINQYADELDNLQAEMYLKINQLSDAKELLEKIYENQKNNEIPLKATILANLGTCEWLDGNNSQANEYLQSALTLKKKLFAPQSAEIAAAYNDLGVVSVATSPEIALENYQKSAEIYKKIYPAVHPKNAIALTNEAIVQREKKNYVKALANLREAQEIYQKLYAGTENTSKKRPNEAFVISLIGQIHADEGKLTLAQENQQEALNIYQENYGQKHPEIASTYNIIGTLFERQGNYKSALNSYQSAILANTKTFSDKDVSKNPPTNDAYKPQLLLNSIFFKAEALETKFSSKSLKISDLDKSIECFEICDTLIQKVRQNSVNQQDKLQISALADQIYESAISVCMQASEGAISKKIYKEKAFYFSEKSKASALLEAIAETKAKSFAGIPADVLLKEEDLKANITFFEQQVATGNREQDFETLLRNAKTSYLVFIKDMEKNYPQYYQLKYGTNSTSIEKIREKINENTMLVSYFWAKKRARIYVFYLSKTDLSVENVLQQPDFEDNTIVLNNSIKFYAKNTFIASSHALYKQLFPKKVAEKYTELLIIADSKMPTIPFEALLLQKDRKATLYKNMSFMLKKYAISYNYSASLLTEKTAVPSGNANNNQESILLVAPVKFESFGLNNLPGTATEVEKIAKIFKEKNGKATILQENQASELNLKKQDLMSYSYVHLATHGVVDAVNPELSQVFLSNVDADKQNDNHLYSGEIYNLKINAKLVSLSACETGLGKMSDGEGIIGLSRALLYAGAQSVNVSLWKVSDASTSDLMGNLFENIIKNNKNHTLALQQAKTSLLNSEKFSAPYFWAAFILIGN